MKNLYFLSFAAGPEKYVLALRRLKAQAIATNWFSDVMAFGANDLPDLNPIWFRRHRDFLECQKRLFGYAIWKPMIISAVLRELPLGATSFIRILGGS
jgi:hypothetical protein